MLFFYLNLLETQEDKDKFEYLYKRYSPLLKHVAYQKLHNEQWAEDAVHNAFLKIIKSFCEIDDPAGHKARHFLVIVTERAAIDILRKEKPDLYVSYDESESPLANWPNFLDGMAVEDLVQRIRDLPEMYRTVLELRVYQHLSEKQIATLLNVSYATARKRLERARNLLAASIREQEEEPYETV